VLRTTARGAFPIHSPPGNAKDSKGKPMKEVIQQPATGKSTTVALAPRDLAMVLLVRDRPGSGQPVPTVTVPQLRQQVTLLAGLGIRALKVFASSTRRDPHRAPWKAPADLMTQAITEIKAAAPP